MTPQKDKAIRQERSSQITTTYLNRKYFFGSDSPATREQQSDVSQLYNQKKCLFTNVTMLVVPQLHWIWIIVNFLEKTLQRQRVETGGRWHDSSKMGFEIRLKLNIQIW